MKEKGVNVLLPSKKKSKIKNQMSNFFAKECVMKRG